MKDWLYPGAKVVCVDDRPAGTNLCPVRVLRLGAVYTVRSIEMVNGLTPDDQWQNNIICVVLEEAVNPTDSFEGFCVDRFRPLTKRNTDAQVEKLKRLLNTTPADLEAVE